MTKPLADTIASLLLVLDGKGDGAPKPLDQRLADAKATLVDIQTQVDNLTRERDAAQNELTTAKDEVTRLTGQFDSVTTEATNAKADVTRLTSELSSEKGEHTATKGKLTTAESNITRLEKLCNVKGIDPAQSVKPGAAPEDKPSLEDLGAEMKAAGSDPKKRAAVVDRVNKFYGPQPTK